jgi:hypothetical protein
MLCVLVTAEGRAPLAAIGGDRSDLHKHVLRSQIIVQAADRRPVLEVVRRAGVSWLTLWYRQRRVAALGPQRDLVGIPLHACRRVLATVLNALFFVLTRRRPRRGVLRSIANLRGAIYR